MERDLVRMLAGKALRWKIVDEDAVSLDWVSLVEGAFPLPKSSHWDLAMQTRIQVIIAVVSSSIVSEPFKSKIFNTYLQELFQPQSFQSERQSSKWAEMVRMKYMALKKFEGEDGKLMVDDLATMFPTTLFLDALSGALDDLDSEIQVDLAHPHSLERLQIIGFSDTLLSDLMNHASTNSKKYAIEKVLELGKKVLEGGCGSTTESSFSFGNTSHPAVEESIEEANACFPIDSFMRLKEVRDAPSKEFCHRSTEGSKSQSPLHNVGWIQMECLQRKSATPSRRGSQTSVATTTNSPISPLLQNSPGLLTVLSPGYVKKTTKQESIEKSQNGAPQTEVGYNRRNTHESRAEKDVPESQTPLNSGGRSQEKVVCANSAQQQAEARSLPDEPSVSRGQSNENLAVQSQRTLPATDHQEGCTIVAEACTGAEASISTNCNQSQTEFQIGQKRAWMPPSAPIKVFSYFPHLAVPADSVPNKQKDVLPRPSKKAKQNTPSSFLGQQSEPVGCSSGKGLGNKRKAQTEGEDIDRSDGAVNDGHRANCSSKKPKLLPAKQVVKKYLKRALENPNETVVFPTIVPRAMRPAALRAERVFKQALKKLKASNPASEGGPQVQQSQSPGKGKSTGDKPTSVCKEKGRDISNSEKVGSNKSSTDFAQLTQLCRGGITKQLL